MKAAIGQAHLQRNRARLKALSAQATAHLSRHGPNGRHDLLALHQVNGEGCFMGDGLHLVFRANGAELPAQGALAHKVRVLPEHVPEHVLIGNGQIRQGRDAEAVQP